MATRRTFLAAGGLALASLALPAIVRGARPVEIRMLSTPRGEEAVDVGEPDGDFIVGDPGHEHIFIAGGIGVTPFRAILLDLDHRELPINATLLYANRNPDFVYKAEMDRLAGRHPRLVVRYLVSPERVTQSSIRGVSAGLAKPIFYVSGPEPFVDALGTMLTGLGVPDGQVKSDFFPGYDWS